jgi:SAM-dependent methyltransferase
MNQNLNDHYHLADGVWLPRTSNQSAAEFTYSDGDEVERRIYDTVAGVSDKTLFSRELASHINDWPSQYHLSCVRSNLLRPLEAALKGPILELGAGCGAVTRYLGEIGSQVTAVEGSLARARIARERTSDLSNVTVVCDRIESFTASSKFKVVTLIGVLEYARAFAPYKGFSERDLLSHALSHLDDNGFLILAIENQLGLKYLAGAKEDHVSIPYYGINDSYDADTAVTFGKSELKQILSDAGLTHQRVFVPLPDYKLPITVLSPEGSVPGGLFDAEAQILQSVLADPQRPATPFFSLERALAVSYRNGLAQEHAGSFLIVASRMAEALRPISKPEKLAWHYSLGRAPAFMKQAAFVLEGDRVVVKRSRVSNAPAPDTPIQNILKDEAYISGENMWVELSRLLNRPDWDVDVLGAWAKPWIELLATRAGVQERSAMRAQEAVNGFLFDATPLNTAMDSDGRLQFFDQEWRIKSDIEIGFVLFRGLRDSLARITSCAAPVAGTPLKGVELIQAILTYNGISITEADILRYQQLEWRVQRWVQGEPDAQPSDEMLPNPADWALNIRTTIDNFNEIVAERNVLFSERDELRANVARLSSENARLTPRIEKRNAELARRASKIELQAERIKLQKSELQAIHSSTSWKLMQIARHVDERNPTASKATRWILRRAGLVLRKVRKFNG